jgi:hypothetical protein
MTQLISKHFQKLVKDANGYNVGMWYSAKSSMGPLVKAVKGKDDSDLNWKNKDGKPGLVSFLRDVPYDKKVKYASAIKYLQKVTEGHNSKIFAALKEHADKLSKSQQRYTIPMLIGDGEVNDVNRAHAAHGLCQNLTLMWLKEQLKGSGSQFPRINTGNVLAHKESYQSTKDAARMQKQDEVNTGDELGLRVERKTWGHPFSSNDIVQGKLGKALYVRILNGGHALGIFRVNNTTIDFFDSNAGSYRLPIEKWQAFIKCYHEECLPKKWPGTYVKTSFDQVSEVKLL